MRPVGGRGVPGHARQARRTQCVPLRADRLVRAPVEGQLEGLRHAHIPAPRRGRLSTGCTGCLWTEGPVLWTGRAPLWRTRRARETRRETCPKALAEPAPDDIELLPRTPPGERDRSERRSVRRSTSLLEGRRGSRVTRLPGSERGRDRSGASPVPINRRALVTHTHKGPSPISASTVPRRTSLGAEVSRHDGNVPRTSVTITVRSYSAPVDEPVETLGFLWRARKYPEKIRKTLVPAPPDDIDFSHALLREGGIGRNEDPVRRSTSLLEDRRGSRVTRLPGSERRRDRSGASPVPINRRALATHTRKGPSPISAPVRAGSVAESARVLRRSSPQECRDLCMNRRFLWRRMSLLWTRTAFQKCPGISFRKGLCGPASAA